jgi:hypothetical protein
MDNMNTINIFNERYGTSVATNGNIIAIGNPPTKNWQYAEGFSYKGQVILVRKNQFKSNYEVIKTLFNENENLMTPYYTEQSSSAVNTSSLIANSGSLPNVNNSCSYLTIEDNTKYVYQSKYGESLDLSDYFLAVSDISFSQSIDSRNFFTQNQVNIYKIDPNYVYESGSIQPISSEYTKETISTYEVSSHPFAFLTGSFDSQFGKSVSISNNYLAVGAPNALNGRGKVYVYKNVNDEYVLVQQLTSSISLDPYQSNFGFSVCIDKYSEDKIVVGSNQISASKVFLFTSGSDGWRLTQKFQNITGSEYLKLEGMEFDLFPSGSLSAAQQKNRFGYSVSIHKNVLSIGSPNDLLYYEYSGSNTLRQRGAVYVYENGLCPTGSNDYLFIKKIYGDEITFKDNMMGYSVSTFNNKILIGSPKPYFPFSSLYISSSINYYDKFYDPNDFGEASYCGQCLYYNVSQSKVIQITTDPISKRKEFNKPFTAFGYSTALSNDNLIIGAPIPLNQDLYLDTPLITESGSYADPSYVGTSSYNPENCNESSDVIYFQIEDTVYASGSVEAKIALRMESETYDKIIGKCYIYDNLDLRTNYTIGNIFYNNNSIVINNTGSVLNLLTRDPVDTNNPALYMDYKSLVTTYEKQYVCKVTPGEFNISTNPTAVTSSLINYCVLNKETFDFQNLDLILRYINYKNVVPGSEKWYLNMISNDVEQNIFGFYTSSYVNYNTNILTQNYKNILAEKNFDIDKDGKVDIQDGIMLWKYFIEKLNFSNYTKYINSLSTRNNYDDIIRFLDLQTGKFTQNLIKSNFFNYKFSSSIDPTGSYLAPYITTVGLYSNCDLVAVAKLAQPIKNTGEIPINILVKWDT